MGNKPAKKQQTTLNAKSVVEERSAPAMPQALFSVCIKQIGTDTYVLARGTGETLTEPMTWAEAVDAFGQRGYR